MRTQALKQDLLIRTQQGGLDLLKLAQLSPARYPYLLESVSHGEGQTIGRYSILLAFPQQKLECHGFNEIEAFIQKAQALLAESACDFSELDLPFKGGWFGYFGYDYAQAVEPILDLPASDLPLAILHRMPAAIILDHRKDELILLAEADYADALAQMQVDVAQARQQELSLSSFKVTQATEEADDKFLSGVHQIKDYILSGDIFQVNLSRQWDVQLTEACPQSVYAALRRNNPAPFAAFCDFGNWQLLSSSPERLVSYDGEWVETRPIAGTRKRSDDLAADQALIAELISHPKERAEHIMLIDLERNDLGRICQPGTVEVNELMVIESYEHVHHIVSNVRGKLQAGLSPMDVIHAVFPGGTITGCPKVRCMQIIAELEQMPRRAYTGSLGYINRDGSLDFNILIRTMIQQGQQISFRAGAGIVADSIAEKELEESRHKAKGLLNALR